MTDRESRFHEARIRQLADYLPNLFYPQEVPFEIQAHTSPDPVPFADLKRCELRNLAEGQTWGQAWASAWFRFRGTVPAAWRGRRVVARLQLVAGVSLFSLATPGQCCAGLRPGADRQPGRSPGGS